MFINQILIAASALISASVVTASSTANQKWQILALSTNSPSGLPGNANSFPRLDTQIQNPNAYKYSTTSNVPGSFSPSSANCTISWVDKVPWDIAQPCHSSDDYSTWTLTMSKGTAGASASGFDDFVLLFKLVERENVVHNGVEKQYSRFFTGGNHFNNLKEFCAASGSCGWILEQTPYAINQTEQKS